MLALVAKLNWQVLISALQSGIPFTDPMCLKGFPGTSLFSISKNRTFCIEVNYAVVFFLRFPRDVIRLPLLLLARSSITRTENDSKVSPIFCA